MAKNWAIAIGINNYNPNNFTPLKYAKRDAELMRDFFQNEAKFDEVYLFTDDSPDLTLRDGTRVPTQPTYDHLVSFLEDRFDRSFLATGDNFWFFFAGHGMRHDNWDYLMPQGANPRAVERAGIPVDYIYKRLSRCGADNVILILDACRSEGSRGAVGIGSEVHQGIITITACSPTQRSWEIDELQQGVFTYALLEALRLSGEESCATVERLSNYLRDRVPALCRRYNKPEQNPRISADPSEKHHFILMPQNAWDRDISALRELAYQEAFLKHNLTLAEQLCIRANAAAKGRDIQVLELFNRIKQLQTGGSSTTTPHANLSPNISSSDSSFAPESIPETEKREDVQLIRSSAEFQRLAVELLHPTVSQVTRQRFLKWLGFGGLGVALTAILGQMLSKQSSEPLPQVSTVQPLPITPTANPSPSIGSSIDYTKLENFLKAKQWKEADQETLALMMKVSGREKEGDLDRISLQEFPCEVIRAIDQLWVENSSGQFGFSVQQKIYLDLGGPMNGHYDSPAWNKFGGFVGWLVKDQHSSYWISYSQVTFDTQARRGHLPWSPIWFGFGTYEKYDFPVFVSRLASCDIPLSLVSSDAQPSPNTPPASPTAPDQVPVDYTKLESLLKAKQWKQADQETMAVMLKVVGREVGDTINRNNIRDFPCQVLNTINQLWVSQSKGQFGFSVQKTVYLELGGPANGLYDEKAWHQFCDTVGWLVKDPNPRWNRREWLSYVNVTFNTSARKGHLPTPFMWDWWSQGSWFSDLIAKLGKCDI